MEPNATLREIHEALNAGDYAKAREYADYLREWLDARGFAPDWNAYPYAARYFSLRHTYPLKLTFATS